MLKNAPTLAIVAVDTAENEPLKISMKWGSQTGVAPVIGQPAATPRQCHAGHRAACRDSSAVQKCFFNCRNY